MPESSELAAEADGSEAWKPTMGVDEVTPSIASKDQDEDPRHIEQNPKSSERAISIDIDIDLSESAQTSKRLSADDSNSPTTFGEPDKLLSPVFPAIAPDAKMAVSEDGQQQSASKTIHEDRLAAVDGVEVLEPTLLAVQTHRSSVASQGSRTSSMDACEEEKSTVLHGVCLIAFHHTFGPIVEYSYPPELKDDEDIVKNLPFLALPDGAHMREEDYSCFHLYLPRISTSTIYGISCVRQLRADTLLKKTADITRSTVQKAVVVLANKPVFGPIRDKLGVITRTFFAQRDFEDTLILEHFYSSLEMALRDQEQTGEAAIYMGMSLRELVWKFRLQTLILFKLLLLQRKVMLWGSQVERLCSFQYSLVSLVPLLLLNLEDAASPLLDSRARIVSKASSLKTSDRKSLLTYLGLPLNLFGKDAFFQPYLTLQQMDLLHCKSYLVGTTNSIFQAQKDCPIDVLVNIETANIEYLDPKIASLVHLTSADRKWMDDIVRIIEATWNPADPHRPVGMGFKGSDDWLRSKFEEYICSALSAMKFVEFLEKDRMGNVMINSSDPTGLASFNEAWVAGFRKSPAYQLWDEHTDPVIFDLVEPKHPCEGQATLVEDVGIRLVNGLHDLHLDEKLGPTQEAISKGIASGSEGIWKAYSSIKADLAKRQADFRERREQEQQKQKEQLSPDEQALKDMEEMNRQLLSTHVMAGATEVGTRAASLASTFGSFLGSKIAKPRSSLLAAPGASSSLSPASPTASLEATAKRSSVDTIGSLSSVNDDDDLTPQKPAPQRASFFTGFRSPFASGVSGGSTAQSPDQATAQATNPSAAITGEARPSAFGSFFRRTSGGMGKTAEPTPTLKSSVRMTLDAAGPNTTAIPISELENTASVRASEPKQRGEAGDRGTSDGQSSRSELLGQKRTSMSRLSDVKL